VQLGQFIVMVHAAIAADERPVPPGTTPGMSPGHAIAQNLYLVRHPKKPAHSWITRYLQVIASLAHN
jgi:hypothetical protein